MRVLIDLAGIVVVYCVYVVTSVFVYGWDRFSGDQAKWPLVMICASLGCMLIWYALGEWVIRPSTASGTWYAVWFLLLAVIIGTAAFVFFSESRDVASQTDLEAHPWLHFLGGAGFYYLASVLFSPTFAKYRIWPARHVRSW